jgi:hypothetical protein
MTWRAQTRTYVVKPLLHFLFSLDEQSGRGLNEFSETMSPASLRVTRSTPRARAVGYRRGRVIVLSVCGQLSRAWKSRENLQEQDGVEVLTSARLPLAHDASTSDEIISSLGDTRRPKTLFTSRDVISTTFSTR